MRLIVGSRFLLINEQKLAMSRNLGSYCYTY